LFLLYYILSSPRKTDLTKVSFTSNADVGVYYWINGATRYPLAGSIDREELLKAAKIIYQQLGY
jgi:anti-sigma factor RsiW